MLELGGMIEVTTENSSDAELGEALSKLEAVGSRFEDDASEVGSIDDRNALEIDGEAVEVVCTKSQRSIVRYSVVISELTYVNPSFVIVIVLVGYTVEVIVSQEDDADDADAIDSAGNTCRRSTPLLALASPRPKVVPRTNSVASLDGPMMDIDSSRTNDACILAELECS